ncbi:DUF4352 domain-containing protein [Streptomyces pactum]|uniref:DUF4352 domain-containing protein n=1 Tax=Streptomyces pactum TaxID=68249 RepID=A0ABS0NE66_9ACTN|nr:DUF4352 domain-containing protein [Streptomyces pactum]MBH5333462.1 DUF4352 domain-containing protein [Streptomyces pactum]
MRIRAAALAAALLCLPLTACGGDDGDDKVTSRPKKQSSAPADPADDASQDGDAAPEQSEEAPEEEKQPEVAGIGDTITLKGQEEGTQLDVTVKKWLDPAQGANEYETPEEGKRWVAAQLLLVNTGSATYSDSPSNGLQLADTEGQRFDATLGEISAGPQMTSDLNLPKGDKALGWIVIEIPKASKPATLQFTMDSGYADQTGQWKIS